MPKILIVDDEKMMLKIASKILSRDYDVICAGTGAEAIELFMHESPDMVLSDLIMPEIDGYELQRRLQEISSRPVPIMFMTADDSDENESKSFALGASDYIHKPLKGDILLRRVKNILDRLDKIQDLTEAANLDLMTGLLNKTAAQREIGNLCADNQGVLMLLDLDNFKLVNDLYGHAMGDKILIRFAELIKGVIHSTDLAGRIGGDEFVAFCRNVRDEKIIFYKATFLNEQLLTAAKNFMGDDMEIPLGTSIGAVFVPDEGTDFAALMQKADKALYKVKHGNKHGCAFFGEDTSIATDHKNISQMQMILAERNGETGALFVDFDKFKAVYQYAARLNKNSTQLLEMTLADDDDAAHEDFLDTLIKILRRSDCVTHYGRDKFLALLNDTSPEQIADLQKKIVAAWQNKNFGGKLTFAANNL